MPGIHSSTSLPPTPLVTAINATKKRFFQCLRNGQVSDLKLLLPVLASEIKRVNFRAALYYAIKSGSLECIKVLLDDLVYDNYLEPFSSEQNEYLLTNSNVNVNVCATKLSILEILNNPCSPIGYSPLMVAISLNYLDISKYFLSLGSDTNYSSHICNKFRSVLDSIHESLEDKSTDTSVSSFNLSSTSVYNSPSLSSQDMLPITGTGLLIAPLDLSTNSKSDLDLTIVDSNTNSNDLDSDLLSAHLSLDMVGNNPSNSESHLGSHPNCLDNCGYTALHLASISNNIPLVRLLLSKNANVNVTTYNSITPLFFAAQHGHTELMLELLKYSADPNISRKDGASPLYKAVEKNNIDGVKVLTLPMVEIDDYHVQYLSRCNDNSQNLLVNGENTLNSDKLSLKHDIGMNDSESTKSEKQSLFICTKVDTISSDGMTPLTVAVIQKNYEIVEFLLSRGASTNINVNIDISNIKSNTVDSNISSSYHTKETSNSQINSAGLDSQVSSEMTKNIEPETLTGSDPSTQNMSFSLSPVSTPSSLPLPSPTLSPSAFLPHDKTPLHFAVMMKDEAIVKLLLTHGSRVVCYDKHMKSPLMIAEKLKLDNIVTLLRDYADLQSGVDSTKKSKKNIIFADINETTSENKPELQKKQLRRSTSISSAKTSVKRVKVQPSKNHKNDNSVGVSLLGENNNRRLSVEEIEVTPLVFLDN